MFGIEAERPIVGLRGSGFVPQLLFNKFAEFEGGRRQFVGPAQHIDADLHLLC